MVHARDDIEGLDAAILMHPRVWEASRATSPASPIRSSTAATARTAFAPTTRRIKGTPGTAGRAVSRLRHARARSPSRAMFNLMFKTFMGPVEEQRGGRLPAAGDGAGHLRQLPERPAVDAAEDSVRHRADRQGVPQRDHAGQLHLPHARVRADGDAVLRRAGHRHGVVRVLEGAADGVASRTSASRRTRLQFHQHGTDELAHYARAAFDIQFDFGGTLGFQEIEGIHNRGDFDLGRHQEYLGQEARVLRSGRRTSATCRTSSRRRPAPTASTLALLVNAYREEKVEGETQASVLGLSSRASRRSRPACSRW